MTDYKLSPRSAGFVLVALLTAFMLFLAVRGFFDPLAAAHGFGIDLGDARDAFYIHVKADRDLMVGLALLALLAYRRALPLTLLVAAGTVAPVFDCALSLLDPRGHAVYALAVHGSAVLYGIVTVFVLVRAAARRPA